MPAGNEGVPVVDRGAALVAEGAGPLVEELVVGVEAGLVDRLPLALTLINLRTRTADGSAALSGFTQAVGYTLACLGPLLFGVLKDAGGSLAWPFAMLVASVLVMLVGAWQACRPRMLEDHW